MVGRDRVGANMYRSNNNKVGHMDSWSIPPVAPQTGFWLIANKLRVIRWTPRCPPDIHDPVLNCSALTSLKAYCWGRTIAVEQVRWLALV